MLSICGMRDARCALIQKGAHGGMCFSRKAIKRLQASPISLGISPSKRAGNRHGPIYSYCGGPSCAPEWGFLLGVDPPHKPGSGLKPGFHTRQPVHTLPSAFVAQRVRRPLSAREKHAHLRPHYATVSHDDAQTLAKVDYGAVSRQHLCHKPAARRTQRSENRCRCRARS